MKFKIGDKVRIKQITFYSDINKDNPYVLDFLYKEAEVVRVEESVGVIRGVKGNYIYPTIKGYKLDIDDESFWWGDSELELIESK